MMNKYSTILIKSTTREQLKEVGRKGQTYDQLLNELLFLKRNSVKGSSDSRIGKATQNRIPTSQELKHI
jgi:hypothetical protein